MCVTNWLFTEILYMNGKYIFIDFTLVYYIFIALKATVRY